MPDFPIIDTHVHFWDRDAVPVSWMTGLPIDRPFLPGDLLADAASVAIEGLVFVEADVATGHHHDEVAFIERLAAEEPCIQAIIAHAPLSGAAIHEDLVRLAARPMVRGVRHLIQGKDAAALCADPAFREAIRLLPAHGLHFELCLLHDQLADVLRLVEACPEVTFVLDHIAKPGIKAGLREPWWQEIAAIAQCETVTCKLSGVATEADHQGWNEAELHPYIERVLEVFGPERVIFGSDWPVMRLAIDYTRWVAIVDAALAPLPEAQRHMVFNANAKRVYRLG
jgi:L-fuconolactonase